MLVLVHGSFKRGQVLPSQLGCAITCSTLKQRHDMVSLLSGVNRLARWRRGTPVSSHAPLKSAADAIGL
jgi:hypothetical protein